MMCLIAGRRRATDDMWIFTVPQQGENRAGQRGETAMSGRNQGQQQQQANDTAPQKHWDDLPSYEDALKMPTLNQKDTTVHV